eukprot:2854425-Rhodomonas_salina.5
MSGTDITYACNRTSLALSLLHDPSPSLSPPSSLRARTPQWQSRVKRGGTVAGQNQDSFGGLCYAPTRVCGTDIALEAVLPAY